MKTNTTSLGEIIDAVDEDIMYGTHFSMRMIIEQDSASGLRYLLDQEENLCNIGFLYNKGSLKLIKIYWKWRREHDYDFAPYLGKAPVYLGKQARWILKKRFPTIFEQVPLTHDNGSWYV